MAIYYPPKPENYKLEIPISLWKLYKGLNWNDRIKIEMDTFEQSENAIEVIKEFMDKGAYTFCHFTANYERLIVFRDADTDEYIRILGNKDGKETKQGV